MALITADLRIPEIAELFPATRRHHASGLKPCGTGAARRRHQRRGEPLDEMCRAWHNTANRSYRAGTGYKA